MIKVKNLHIYPVKGMKGIDLTESRVFGRGFEHDRRWMLVSPKGTFLTQRELPSLTQFHTAITKEGLLIGLRQMSDAVTIPFPVPDARPEKPKTAHTMMVQVWGSRVRAEVQAPDTNAWLSDRLGTPVLLVRMPETTRRSVPPFYAGKGQTVSFADGYPYLLATQASLDDLNHRLDQPVPMDRFRPNIVIEGPLSPWEEDQWNSLTIGEVGMKAVKPCARCIVITTDQATGERSKEPLATLSTFRRNGNKVLFGQNVILTQLKEQGKTIKVGDPLHHGAE